MGRILDLNQHGDDAYNVCCAIRRIGAHIFMCRREQTGLSWVSVCWFTVPRASVGDRPLESHAHTHAHIYIYILQTVLALRGSYLGSIEVPLYARISRRRLLA